MVRMLLLQPLKTVLFVVDVASVVAYHHCEAEFAATPLQDRAVCCCCTTVAACHHGGASVFAEAHQNRCILSPR